MESVLQRHQRVRICPVCGQQVQGRRNKVYCRPDCKTLYNNDLARDKRIQEQELSADYIHNYRLLARLLNENGDAPCDISMSKLVELGFRSVTPSIRRTVNGVLTYCISDIGIQNTDHQDTKRILRIP